MGSWRHFYCFFKAKITNISLFQLINGETDLIFFVLGNIQTEYGSCGLTEQAL